MGVDGLKLLRTAGDENDMATISEVMELGQIEEMLEYVDILQVGARNMQNFNLLAAWDNPQTVLLKRGMSSTIQESLLAAKYIMSGGNYED